MITRDGYAKVLDFGLAKLRELHGEDAATIVKTKTGVAVGTLMYMSPEQLSGGEVGPASDVYSLGVVLYEMLYGRRPQDGIPTPSRPDVPRKLAAVINKAVAKNADERYANAGQMLDELRSWAPVPLVSAGRESSIIKAAVAMIVVVAIGAGIWMVARSKRVRSAESSIKRAEEFLAHRQFAEAYEAASAAAAVLPANDRVRDVIAQSSDQVSIESDPPGARILVERFKGPPQPLHAGATPLSIRLSRADYVLTFDKPGFAPVRKPLSMMPFYVRGSLVPARTSPRVRVKLIESAKLPPDMVFVDGGEFSLAGWSRPSDRSVMLRDFLIDRVEVSNRDFDEFVRAGGYRRRDLWKHPFLDVGKTLTFEQTMARFHDMTGLPGPRNWSGGAPPAGRENHPVTDVTWYEAAAFAEWKGKKLPTIYQWGKAARYSGGIQIGQTLPWGVVGEGVDATERANFLGKGTMPVDSMPFGISPYGAYNMAGNVAEWCGNPKGPGFAFRGGGWNDAVYAFGEIGGYPGFFSGPALGFRCVKDLTPDPGDQGDFALSAAEVVPQYHPVSDSEFAEIRSLYDYPKTPLNARVMEIVQTKDWRREKIAYDVNGNTVLAYLYLPNNFRRPLQVVHSAPAGDVDGGFRTLPESIEANLPPLIRSGRAIFSVVLEGYVGRPRRAELEQPDTRSTEFVSYVVERVTEMRRGLDYIETRLDLDHSRIAFMAQSAGTYTGAILTGVEPRYRSVLFIGTGIEPRSITDAAAANRINFAPRIAGPKMMLHGLYDEDTPFTNAESLYRLLREPKRLQVFEGGHSPPIDVFVPATRKWFNETLGPVEQ